MSIEEEIEIYPLDNVTSLPKYDVTYMPNETNMSAPFHLDEQMTPYTVPIYGYISPILVVFTIVTNTLVCIVLLKKNMRSPTNALLVGLALSDMLTGIWSVPCFIYFYTLSRYKEYVPFDWCAVYHLLVFHLPTVFHTASIWLTVALAVQRYIYVCHPIRAKRWCSIPIVIKGSLIVYAISILSHFFMFVNRMYLYVQVPSKENPGLYNVSACVMKTPPLIEQNEDILFSSYYWFRVIFIHLIPCLSLVVLNGILVRAMRAAQRRRETLLKQNRKTECKRIYDSNCTTLMLVAVVGVFLLVEFPLGITFILLIVSNTFNIVIMTNDTQNTATLFTNLFILLSYPINFFIYCGMSRQFRNTFKQLFLPGTQSAEERERSQYMSLATTNGGRTIDTHETNI